MRDIYASYLPLVLPNKRHIHQKRRAKNSPNSIPFTKLHSTHQPNPTYRIHSLNSLNDVAQTVRPGLRLWVLRFILHGLLWRRRRLMSRRRCGLTSGFSGWALNRRAGHVWLTCVGLFEELFPRHNCCFSGPQLHGEPQAAAGRLEWWPCLRPGPGVGPATLAAFYHQFSALQVNFETWVENKDKNGERILGGKP